MKVLVIFSPFFVFIVSSPPSIKEGFSVHN